MSAETNSKYRRKTEIQLNFAKKRCRSRIMVSKQLKTECFHREKIENFAIVTSFKTPLL